MNKIFVVIAASGNGTRFSKDLPKQFSSIDGDVVIRKVVRLFLSMKEISGVICVIPNGFLDLYKKTFKDFNDKRLLDPVFGGVFRQESVKAGLENISGLCPKYVLIHDAARTNVDIELITRVIDSLKSGNRAVVPSVKPVDSIRYLGNAIDRNEVHLIQTPQGFEFNLIYDLHRKYEGKNASDDASLCDFDGVMVNITDGNINNKKLTYQDDVSQSKIKTGFGLDTHAFSEDKNRKLYLMGVFIEGYRGLDGVSDADVGIHSLVDAIIGALGLGSIGEHFPPSDPKWRGAESKIFLEHCRNLLTEACYKIVNIDTTIVCEEPNILKHSNEMKTIISSCLCIPPESINIKGKTTEGLGYEGRKEGISAYSSILIEKI